MGVPAKVVRPATEADRLLILGLGQRYAENTIPGYRESKPEALGS
jgi:hypothetical protein